MTQPTALQVIDRTPSDIIPMIDIAAQKARMENVREFVKSTLSAEHGHYGTMPGVKRDFLLQPGAEALYRAFEARPEYEIVESTQNRDDDYCYFLFKCKVVHVVSGFVMGEDFGAASSDEFASQCKAARRPRKQGDNHLVECPTHGPGTGKETWEWGDVRGQKDYFIDCPKKVPLGLDRTLQNTMSKAKKRAMVAAIRQVGCVSELFSQDSDLMTDEPAQPAAKPPVQQPRAKSAQPAAAAPAAAPKAAPKQAPKAAPAPTDAPSFDIEAVKDAMATVKGAEISNEEIAVFFTDEGTMKAGDKLSAQLVINWCEANKVVPADWAAKVVERFKPAAEEPAEGEVVEGDFSEVAFPD